MEQLDGSSHGQLGGIFAAAAYAATIKAPKKHLTTIEDAGHFALAAHQSAFIAELKTCLAL